MCTTRHLGFLTLLFDIEGTSKEDPKRGKSRKAGKVEERLFKSREKALQNSMQITPICQVLLKLQGSEHHHMQLETTAKLAPLRL